MKIKNKDIAYQLIMETNDLERGVSRLDEMIVTVQIPGEMGMKPIIDGPALKPRLSDIEYRLPEEKITEAVRQFKKRIHKIFDAQIQHNNEQLSKL